MSDILDAKITRKELLNKSDISNLIKNSDLNTKLKTLTAKADLKAEQDEIKELQMFDSSYFHGKTFFFGDDGFQNMFVYQETLDTL